MTSALEVKDDILLLLARERNPDHLERIRAFIVSVAFDEEMEDVDWWIELPEEAQQRLLRIRDEMRRGENVITHKEAKQRLNLGGYADRMVG